MSKTLTVRLDDEAEAALSQRERDEPGLSTAEIIREAIGEWSSVVYFVKRSDGAVKIGFTASLVTRMQKLKAEYGELTLMALSPGGRTEAAEFHARLASSALGHEWFLGNDVDETIRSVLSANGPPEDIAKMLKPRMTHFHLFLSKEERAQLDAAAAEQGISRADVLRQSFRNYPKTKET